MTTIITTTTRTSATGSLRLQVERRDLRSVLVSAEGHIPYAAREVPGRPGWIRLVLVQTIAGPLSGDRTTIEIEIGRGASLEVIGNAATLAFPCAEPAHHDVRIQVGRGARVAWLPEPLILSAGCDLDASLTLELEGGAAALTRELVVLGRFGEKPGRYRSRLRCEHEDRPLLHDEIHIGGTQRASPVALDGARSFGSLALLGVDPGAEVDPDEFRLAGDGHVLRALAPDAATLRARLAATEEAWLAALL